jgi:ATP-dependent RNA helicase RhlE
LTSFNDFGLAEPILRALTEEKYTSPTSIQAQTIPLALQSRDVIGIAQTGTGKTASFALPVLNHLYAKRLRPKRKSARVLVLSPTRELSGQIADSFRTYGRHLQPLEIALAIGGVPIKRQIRAIARGVEVLVATPGRLLDLVNQCALSLEQVEVLVLDEADRMLDMGFIHDIKRIVTMLPKERQTLFFSATMPQQIIQLAGFMLRNPARVAVTPQSSTAERIEQRVIFIEQASKAALLTEVLKTEKINRVLVFTRTKHGADKVVRTLHKAGLAAEAIHGNKSQNQRERVLAAFRTGSLRILIATDIAARGIDVDGISHVVNYDLPNVAESYVHRIGRTARAGTEGVAISFCDHDERTYLRDIERLIRMSIATTDRRTDERPRPEQAKGHHHANRQNNRPHKRSNLQQQDRHVAHGSHSGKGDNDRQSRQKSNVRLSRPRVPDPEIGFQGKPRRIGNVTFLQRPNDPQRKDGQLGALGYDPVDKFSDKIMPSRK